MHLRDVVQSDGHPDRLSLNTKPVVECLAHDFLCAKCIAVELRYTRGEVDAVIAELGRVFRLRSSVPCRSCGRADSVTFFQAER